MFRPSRHSYNSFPESLSLFFAIFAVIWFFPVFASYVRIRTRKSSRRQCIGSDWIQCWICFMFDSCRCRLCVVWCSVVCSLSGTSVCLVSFAAFFCCCCSHAAACQSHEFYCVFHMCINIFTLHVYPNCRAKTEHHTQRLVSVAGDNGCRHWFVYFSLATFFFNSFYFIWFDSFRCVRIFISQPAPPPPVPKLGSTNYIVMGERNSFIAFGTNLLCLCARLCGRARARLGVGDVHI